MRCWRAGNTECTFLGRTLRSELAEIPAKEIGLANKAGGPEAKERAIQRVAPRKQAHICHKLLHEA